MYTHTLVVVCIPAGIQGARRIDFCIAQLKA